LSARGWPALAALALTGCTLIIGGREKSKGLGGDAGEMFDGGSDGGGASVCQLRGALRVGAVPALSGYDDAPAIARIGGGQFVITWIDGGKLSAIIVTPDNGGGVRTIGPEVVYTCQKQCTMARVSRRLPGEDLVFGVLDGLTPTLVTTSATLLPPAASPAPLTACGGSGSFDVIGDGANQLLLAACANRDLVATGNNVASKTLQNASAIEVRAQGQDHPSSMVWTTTDNKVWLGDIAADIGNLGNMHVVDPSSAAGGVGFDVIAGSPNQFLIAYSLGNGQIRVVPADLTGGVGAAQTIVQTVTATPRTPLSVASAPGTVMRTHPLFMLAYTALDAIATPRVAAQAIDVNGALFGVPVLPSQLVSHAAAVAYDPEPDLFAMTWIGPDSASSLSDSLLHVGFIGCPQ
jgi:hypothetical protein